MLYALSTESRGRTLTKLVEIELLGPCTLPSVSDPGPLLLVESMSLTATIGSRSVKWSSPLLRVAVRVYEADGRLLQRTEAKVPETVLQSGMHPALELSSEWKAKLALPGGVPPAEPSDLDMRTLGEGVVVLPTLLGILQDDGVLESLLVQVVGPPSLLSLLRGIQVGVSCDIERASLLEHPAAPPCAPGSVYRLPLRINVNDDPALDLEFDVAAADPPLRLSGGILSLRGVSCRGPERRVTLELRAARRGPPGAELRL